MKALILRVALYNSSVAEMGVALQLYGTDLQSSGLRSDKDSCKGLAEFICKLFSIAEGRQFAMEGRETKQIL